MTEIFNLGSGWVPESYSAKDLHYLHAEIQPCLETRGVLDFIECPSNLPGTVDLRQWAPPIHFQGGYNTCSAHVVACLLEYFENKAFDQSTQASRLFLYKVAKNYLQEEGNGGVYIRQAMGVLKSVGVPPEKYWPYLNAGTFLAPCKDDPRIDLEPTAFCYAVAKNFEAISYYRLDRPGDELDDSLLGRAKAHLAAGLPFAVGFPLYGSIKQSKQTGEILFPAADEKVVGNHAVVAMGYDDSLKIGGKDGHAETTGAILIHNSWSTDWGQKGYGWIPYQFITDGLMADFWTLTRAEWEDLSVFQKSAPQG